MMTPHEARQFEAEWRSRFERYARTHESEALISGWSETGLERRLSLFGSLLASLRLPASAAALDLGCGGGTYVRLLGDMGHRPVGLDYSVPSVCRAKGADPGRKGSYLAGDAGSLPFPDGMFDLVVSIGVLQALGQPERAIAEMARVLRPGGALVVEALNARAAIAVARQLQQRLLRRPPRVRAYSPTVVRRWLAAAGLGLERQAGLLLPPRNLPGFAGMLDVPVLRAATARVPGLMEIGAHSFLYVARRGGA